MKIIFGLGNPGEEYAKTRHNTGFETVEKIKEKYDFPDFEMSKKFQAQICKGKIGNEEILLAKPQTFMNLSGNCVQALLDFYKLSPEDILVIHDDLDIGIGKYKLATDSSSAGHNGVQSIIEKLGTQKFKRIRVGIGEEKEDAVVCRVDAHKFVLEKFSPEEREKIEKVILDVVGKIENFL